MPPVLIDTNILVYASDPADIQRQDQALKLLKSLETAGTGRLSIQCVAEFIDVTTRGRTPLYTRAEALQQAGYLLQAYPIFDLTPKIVLEAARGARDHGLAYYDAQIWASARLNQVSTIFSEDFTDGQELESVRFINPFSSHFRLEEWS